MKCEHICNDRTWIWNKFWYSKNFVQKILPENKVGSSGRFECYTSSHAVTLQTQKTLTSLLEIGAATWIELRIYQSSPYILAGLNSKPVFINCLTTSTTRFFLGIAIRGCNRKTQSIMWCKIACAEIVAHSRWGNEKRCRRLLEQYESISVYAYRRAWTHVWYQFPARAACVRHLFL